MNKAFKALKQTVEGGDTLPGRLFDWIIIALIFLSLLAFSIETIPTLPKEWKYALSIFEIVSVIIFSVEYCLRVLVATSKSSFVFSFYGIIDLLAIIPFFISGIDLRSVRAFRLFRLLRLLKLARYTEATTRFRMAFNEARSELVLFVSLTVLLIYLAAIGIYFFERSAQPEKFSSIPECLWWALATLTTVGYGDVYPITSGGKVFTFFILILGLGIVAVPTGIISSALTATRTEKRGQANKERSND